MILKTDLVLKIFMTFATVLIGYFVLRKKLTVGQLLIFCLSVAIFALAADRISKIIPPLRDKIVITALGEKNEAAQADELWFSGYTVDSEVFENGTSLQIRDGKWFWSGETYVWRNELDPRQPAGTTRTITVGIPVGLHRSLNFTMNPWGGKAEIADSQGSEVYDFYSEKERTVSISICESETSLLIWNWILHLAVYAIVFLILSYITAALIIRLKRDSVWREKHSGKLIYGGIAVWAFVLMATYAGNTPFWQDELWQITGTSGTIKEAIQYCLEVREASPPLPFIISTIWYHIAPYGEQWLLMVSTVPVTIAVYAMGLAGERVGGRLFGILSVIFMVTVPTLWGNVAYEYRAYAFMVMFSTLTLYSYIYRNQNPTSKKASVLFGLSMTGLAMSHYYGMIACVCYFVADCFLVYYKQRSWKEVFTYFLPGGVSLIWLVLVVITVVRVGGMQGEVAWQPVPSVALVKDVFDFITGYFTFACWVLFAGVAASLVVAFRLRKETFTWQRFYVSFCGLAFLGTITVMYIYGNINTKHTMWLSRYFFFLLPQSCFLSTWIVGKGAELLGRQEEQTVLIQKTVCLFIAVIMGFNCWSYGIRAQFMLEPNKDAADWIYTQINTIFLDDTVILAPKHVDVGWEKYYIERQGRRDPLHVVCQADIEKEELLAYDTVFTITPLREELQRTLDEMYTLEVDNTTAAAKLYVRNTD